MELDKEIDEFVAKELEKHVTQEDSIDTKQVEEHLGEMGWLFNASREKLEHDKICFNCKKEVVLGKELLHMVETSKVDPGVFAIVSICDTCYNKLRE